MFWVTVVTASPPDQLVAVDPTSAKVTTSIGLPGCSGAHGLRIHPDGLSAFIACESNDVLARVDLGGGHTVATAASGSGPDVLAIDPSLGWLYVAAESGDLTVFDIGQPGVALVGHDHPGDNAHSVAVDSVTHRVFFPLMAGPKGTPVLRVMRPGAEGDGARCAGISGRPVRLPLHFLSASSWRLKTSTMGCPHFLQKSAGISVPVRHSSQYTRRACCEYADQMPANWLY